MHNFMNQNTPLIGSCRPVLLAENVTFYSFNKYLLSVLIDLTVKWVPPNKGAAWERDCPILSLLEVSPL